MNMQLIDWLILFIVITFFTVVAYKTKKYTKGAADFLAANRCAGRYVLAVGDGMAALGAISVVARFQWHFEGGFTPLFWEQMWTLFFLVVAISGWVIYRFRQTRSLTWGQFFELRYSRRFRIFAGSLCFLSGIINFGIFPSVAARFMVYYCGMPHTIDFLGLQLSTYGVILAGLVTIAVCYACLGGQIAVIVTDFLQGLFCNVVFIVILVLLFVKFGWSDISVVLLDRPEGQSMINPFKIEELKNYDHWYYLIGIWGAVYSAYSWAGQQGYNTSARDAHEARMSKILGWIRPLSFVLFVLFLTICVYTILNSPDPKFDQQEAVITQELARIEQLQHTPEVGVQIRKQMTVPVALSHILPTGLIGAFCAVVFVFFISTVDTYLHSWGCIFMQDVLMPLGIKPKSPDKHVNYLRWSIAGVAVFIWLWSFFFQQRSDILMFFALSGILYLGGQGAITIGGLYWKRATTAGAWVAMILNIPVFALAFACDQFWPEIAQSIQPHFPELWASLLNTYPELSKDFPYSHVEIQFWGQILSLTCFIIVSLLTCKEPFNLDKMLHRGKYAIESERTPEDDAQAAGQKWDWKEVLGLKRGMVLGDKIIFGFAYGYLISHLLIIVTFILWHLLFGTTDNLWLTFWHVFIWLYFVLTIGVIIWFAIGGLRDLKDLFRRLATAKRDMLDDGTVINHHNIDKDA